jgi:hypothetical protein
MTRSKFVSQYLTPSQASTVATRRPTEQDKRDARRDRGVDFHVNQATDKE